MAGRGTKFVCRDCGASFGRWSGKCPNCDEWDTLEEVLSPKPSSGHARPSVAPPEVCRLDEITEEHHNRIASEMAELDRVLGGGILPGSAVLVGGDPGIGKSTMLLQALAKVAGNGVPCLYVTCEESLSQIKLRARRLGVADSPMAVVAATSLESVCAALAEHTPLVAAIDSIQMLSTDALESPVGSVSQLRACAGELIQLAKTQGFALFLVGHVTKEGVIAGPKALEHIVDTVLYFESDRFHALRILRAAKNRFGSTGELGVFEMTEGGLRDVANPSELFLAERDPEQSGSVVTAALEGNRALLVEIQALVGPSAYGTPERRATGVDGRRVSMMLSVLERRGGVSLAGSDVFVNVAGGVRIAEPAADLPLVLALAGSSREVPFPAETMAIGEVGLGGEVRSVAQVERRLAEARRLGFKRAVLPAACESAAREADVIPVPVRHVRQALRVLGEL